MRKKKFGGVNVSELPTDIQEELKEEVKTLPAIPTRINSNARGEGTRFLDIVRKLCNFKVFDKKGRENRSKQLAKLYGLTLKFICSADRGVTSIRDREDRIDAMKCLFVELDKQITEDDIDNLIYRVTSRNPQNACNYLVWYWKEWEEEENNE
tara:strand:+ start:58 stop:516 length:459 start_codon:yes stop_codon:yes gene_type:complete